MKTVLWGADDVGCFADECFGPDHALEVLYDLLKATPPRVDPELLDALCDDDHEVQWEAADDALDAINNYVADGYAFAFCEGDLLLAALSELER